MPVGPGPGAGPVEVAGLYAPVTVSDGSGIGALVRPPIVMNAPKGPPLGSVDQFPNLLVTTLAALAILPPGQQLSASAPPPKAPVYVDQPQFHPLTLGMNPQPAVLQLSDSAPPPKPPVYVDQPTFHPLTLGMNPQPGVLRLDQSAPPPKTPVYVDQPLFRPLTLGMNPQPAVRQLWDSAPPPKYAVQVDVYPNLLATTLLPAPPAPFRPVDTSQLQPKYQVQVEAWPNTLVLGYNPQPAVRQLSDSAPPPKGAVYVDQPLKEPLTLGVNPEPAAVQLSDSAPPPKAPVYVDQPTFHPLTLGMNPQPATVQLSDSAPPPKAPVYIDQPTFHPLTLGMNPQPAVRQLSDSAPYPKYSVQVDAYPNTLVLGMNPQPQVRGLSDSAPAVKPPVQVDVYPNLLSSTLKPSGAPIPLPLGQPVDVSQWQGKFAIEVDAWPNVLVLGYPAPPVLAKKGADPLPIPRAVTARVVGKWSGGPHYVWDAELKRWKPYDRRWLQPAPRVAQQLTAAPSEEGAEPAAPVPAVRWATPAASDVPPLEAREMELIELPPWADDGEADDEEALLALLGYRSEDL